MDALLKTPAMLLPLDKSAIARITGPAL